MPPGNPVRKRAVRRLTHAIFWKFALISIAYGGVTYLLNSLIVIGLVSRNVEGNHLPLTITAVNVVFGAIYYALAYALLRWLVSEHVEDAFVLREEAGLVPRQGGANV